MSTMTNTGTDTREKEVLLSALEGTRRHVLTALEGLTDEQLRQPKLPSGWHALGLVQHLTLSDERYWFRCVMGGESTDYFPEGPNAEWQVDPEEPAADVIRRYQEECRRSDELIAATSLDAPPKAPDPTWAEWNMSYPDLRSVIMHVITETAAHAGHMDATRELIDGHQWVVL
ncbi:DinB family protein [Luteipulveratus mongoliensis]|uniref:Mini-circle protein n=1 Tax=Luteipulveratus mongoliensis TaxID=571913 RepID=A0A0K1JEG9_9MICO|nr:DinB family protein [Luteipulveratus mongoliensis]AKU15101.1 hypothetical protein VV02_03190 [Luteipulveratus mongoliensis]